MLHRISRFKIARLVTLALVICFSSFFWPSSPGKADIAPDPWAPGNSIGPANPTQVRMVEEYVQIDLLEPDRLDPSQRRFFQSGFLAHVQADFTMKNLGSAAEEMKVYFPLGTIYENTFEEKISYNDLSIADFAVWVDDQPVNVEHVAVADENSPSVKYVSATFPVHFPVEQEMQIRVAYTFGSKFASGLGGIDTISYIFETGAGWKDTIGKAVLVVNLPHVSSPESVVRMPKGGKVDGRSITWTWMDFEPTKEDNFWLVLAGPERWNSVIALREQIKAHPTNGALWTELGTEYLELATGKMAVEFPYFADLAEKALRKAAQLSPYDREPFYQLAMLHASQGSYWFRDELTQAECKQLVDEINQFLLRTNEGSDYDDKLGNLLGLYDVVICPNALTERRGIYPTLTPAVFPTETPDGTLPAGYMETQLAFENTQTAYDNIQSTRLAGLFPTNTLVATNTFRPTETATLTRTPTRTLTRTPTRILAPSQTASATPVPAPAKADDDWLVFGGVLVVGGVMLSTAYAWQYFYKKSLAKRNARF